MPPIGTPALILQSFSYSETSKILRLLTPERGVVSAIAKGALRPRSRFGGVLDPFTEGIATVYVKPGRDLQTLSGFELTRSRQGLGRNLVGFGAASLLAELVLRTASEHPEAGLFRQLCRALDRLEKAPPEEVEAVALAEAWALVGRLGFAPALDACIACGRRLEADEEAAFDHDGGGVRCLPCSAGGGRRLPPGARRALMLMGRGEAVALERTAAHWRLLAGFLARHVVDGTPVRSMAFLQTALERRTCG